MRIDPPAPRANPDLIGQDDAARTLWQAWRSGRLPHSWILGGPRGIGKATLAFRFARFVLAGGAPDQGNEAGSALKIPADHPVHRRIAAGGHADLLTIERQPVGGDRRGADPKKVRSEIVVEDVREVGAFLRLTPAEGNWRIVVVDGADEMNRNAANALLKILEEPPRQALLLLVSHVPGRLLPTIRSRCRLLTMQGIEAEAMRTLLARFASGLDEGDRNSLIALSEGSIGRALDLLEAGGLELYRDLQALLAPLPRLDMSQVYALADQVSRAGDEASFRTVMTLLQAWVRSVVRSAAGSLDAADGASTAQAQEPPPTAVTATLDRWLAVWDKIASLTAGASWANLDRRQVLVAALLAIEAAAAGRPPSLI